MFNIIFKLNFDKDRFGAGGTERVDRPYLRETSTPGCPNKIFNCFHRVESHKNVFVIWY
jgi:hypothetical protein